MLNHRSHRSWLANDEPSRSEIYVIIMLFGVFRHSEREQNKTVPCRMDTDSLGGPAPRTVKSGERPI